MSCNLRSGLRALVLLIVLLLPATLLANGAADTLGVSETSAAAASTADDADLSLADAGPAGTALAEAPAESAAGTVEANIDSERSNLRFTSTAPAERIVGTASELSGTLHFTPAAPADARGVIRFPVSTMRTGNNLRDRHLRGSDWLEADEHPEIVFTIQSVEVSEQSETDGRIDLQGVAVGTLRMRGVEREVRAPVEVALLTGTKRVRVNFELEANIVEHGLPGRRNSIGREVAEVIQVQGTVYGGWE